MFAAVLSIAIVIAIAMNITGSIAIACNSLSSYDALDYISVVYRVHAFLYFVNRLEDKPFIFITNFQTPGDPPVSIVAYYALPSNWEEIHKDMENIAGFKR